MGIFKTIAKWFFPPYSEYRDSVQKLVEYLPAGNLEVLCNWVSTWITYSGDFDSAGNYDPLQNFNGADLTIRAKSGDCESIAAVFVEIIRHWKGWEASHISFWFTDVYGIKKAHDVCYFKAPDGKEGWIEKEPIYFDNYTIIDWYKKLGWDIYRIEFVNDIGEKINKLQ